MFQIPKCQAGTNGTAQFSQAGPDWGCRGQKVFKYLRSLSLRTLSENKEL